MSTPAIVNFKYKNKSVASIYVHWDGYPECLGEKLKEIFSSMKIVNGFTPSDEFGKTSNGYSDLIIQTIVILKNKSVGNVYAVIGKMYAEYIYTINTDEVDVMPTIKWRKT